MILVDSTVWVDYFNGKSTRQTDLLDQKLGIEPIVIGDLIYTEVLQGFKKVMNSNMPRNFWIRSSFKKCWADPWLSPVR